MTSPSPTWGRRSRICSKRFAAPNQIKDLQSSVKELARDAKEAQKQKASRERNRLAAAPASRGRRMAAPPWQRAQDAYQRGRRSEDLKAYGSAIESFTEAIDLDPKNDSAFLHRGYAHFYLGDFAMAVADIGHSMELQPNNSRAYAMRASALAASGRTSEAIADVEQAIQRDPRNAENYLLRANFHQQWGQAQEALNDYGQAIQLAPESAKAYLGRAAILRTHGQLQQSLADCYKAIQLNPADSAAYLCRAQFYLATGAAQPAIEDINRAMLIGQNPAEAAGLLSAAPVNQGPRPARDANRFYRQGRYLSEQENFEQAAEAFDQAIAIDPSSHPGAECPRIRAASSAELPGRNR
jgi:tetratricopeptide (TPR) repeat protein